MAQKTFTFTKTPKDLTKNPEFLSTRIRVGNMVFTMKSFERVDGHDDSLPYKAVLYINDKPLCNCYNDGWGGDTELKHFDSETRYQIENIKEELKSYWFKYLGVKLPVHLSYIADILANTESVKLSIRNA